MGYQYTEQKCIQYVCISLRVLSDLLKLHIKRHCFLINHANICMKYYA